MDKNSQKTKLKLNFDNKERDSRCFSQLSNCFHNNQNQNDSKYLKLMEKVDQQTQFIKEGFE